jgi:hypothetical protein
MFAEYIAAALRLAEYKIIESDEPGFRIRSRTKWCMGHR